MRQALSVLLLTTLLAPLFPLSLVAQEIGSGTPPTESSEVTPPIEEEVAPAILNQTPLGEVVEDEFQPVVRDGASTTPQFVEEGNRRMMRQSFSVESALAGEEATLYRQVSAYTSNGTVAIGVRSVGTFEYQAGVSYTPAETQVMGAASFVIGRSGERTGHIHAEVWYNGARIAVSEDRDVSEFSTYNSINASQEDFEAGLEKFIFATPVTLLAGENYQIVAGAGDDLSGYLDSWVSFTPAAYPVAQQVYANSAFREILNANFVLYGVATGTPECIQNCNSSVLFLPGLKGSVLKSDTHTLWPADLSGTDFPQLALNDDGTTANNIVVDGILPAFKIHIPLVGDVGPEIYSGYMAFMDGLVASGTIQEWKALPYDWRYSPEYIVSHDIQTPNGPVNLVAQVEEMASLSHSRTGKVTIVAHSMGGLVGKALIQALEEKGEADLIDSFVMVGTPELGTPQAAASLLHGDQEGIPGKSIIPNFVATRYVVRSVGRNLPGAYSLLPAARYFEEVSDPVITFDPVSFTQEWRSYFGDSLDSYQSFAQFLTGTGVVRNRPNPTAISIPEVLRPELVEGANALHDQFDTYQIPSNIRVIEIAGWGEETTKAVTYNAPHIVQSYDTVPTIEGDGVVVYSSATAVGEEKYYFNLFSYKTNQNISIDHGTLLSSAPVQIALAQVFEGTSALNSTYILASKPTSDSAGDRLRVSTHSPVVLGAYDSYGNFSGIYPNQDLSGAYLYIQEEIPGSSFIASGDTQSLYLPKEGSYTFIYKGTGSGPTTVRIETFSGDMLSPVSSYADIPTTSSTAATFVIDSSVPQDTHIQVDQNEDGQTDHYVAPDGGSLSINELVVNLKTAVTGLSTPKPQQKTQLLNKIANIETKIVKQKQKQSNILAKLKAQIAKKVGKGKIDTAAASNLSSLLDDLIAQSAFVPLDTYLIQQLRAQITEVNITTQVKANLLGKVTRLESLMGVTRSLDSMTTVVIKKGAKGVLTDAETQNLLNLLEQIQVAI